MTLGNLVSPQNGRAEESLESTLQEQLLKPHCRTQLPRELLPLHDQRTGEQGHHLPQLLPQNCPISAAICQDGCIAPLFPHVNSFPNQHFMQALFPPCNLVLNWYLVQVHDTWLLDLNHTWELRKALVWASWERSSVQHKGVGHWNRCWMSIFSVCIPHNASYREGAWWMLVQMCVCMCQCAHMLTIDWMFVPTQKSYVKF